MKKTTRIIRVLKYIFIFIIIILPVSAFWVVNTFNSVSFDQIIFHLMVPLEGTGNEMIINYLKNALTPTLILFALFVVSDLILRDTKIWVKFKSSKSKKGLRIKPSIMLTTFTLVLSTFFIINGVNALGIPQYIKTEMTNSQIFENYYVDPKSVNITPPQEKRNLIYIFMESMETTYLSKELGGVQEENLIPNLTKLAEENISFSTSNVFNGAYPVPRTQWTIAGMVSQTAGIPLKIPIHGNDYVNYASFLPGAYSIGDYLKTQDYNQVLFIGSDAVFGGRKDYFKSHGDYKIWDYNTAIEKEKIPKDYHVWWGFEDKKLYEFAKEELIDLANQDKPFNFTMLTVDTHHVGGYVCDLCENEYEDQYANVIACADRQVYEFVRWIQSQDFYENTTIIISGDHDSMDPNFFDNIPNDYVRSVFNVIINSPIQPVQMKNRLFTVFDMYPTTLASLGYKIEGEKLALGTNLFSSEKTLLDIVGKNEIYPELDNNSLYYNKHILYSKK